MTYLDTVVGLYGHRVYSKKNPPHGAAVYIGRPSYFGNPYPLSDEAGRADCVLKYRAWLSSRLTADAHFSEAVKKLRGKNVICFCSNGANSTAEGAKYCHGHVLLSAAEYLHNKDLRL